MVSQKIPCNQIFYGPAGTGKTYHLQQLQAQYTEQRHQPDREEFLAELIRPLVWREVLLLVMLDVNKAVKKSDLMAHRFYQLKAQLNQRANQKGAGIWNVLNDHSIDVPKGAYSVRKEPLVFSELDKNYWIIANPDHDDVQEMRQVLDQIGRGPQGHQQVQRYSMVTFHQSYGYEDFIEGLRPVLNDDSPDGHVRYEIKQGVFVALCERARNDPEHQYAMFIDEINRGNVSKILGELITLIELDKRDGQANAIRVRLPASGAWFSVPANVSLYGSMNTADRSLTPLDTALRRRFECIEMMPDPEALGHRQIDGLDLTTLLHTLNARIELLLGRDALLGQAYFWSVTDLAGLQQVFLYKVLPLLQTYCYDQWQPIRLIFNDHRKPVELQWIQQVDDEARVRQWLGDDVAVAIQPTYRINHAAFADLDSYRMLL